MQQSNTFSAFRLDTLTDGVFAVAMTILILNLKIPAGLNITQLKHFFTTDIYASLLIYCMSFVILGTHWISAHMQQNFTQKVDRISIWLTILLLMIICVIPLSASVLNNYRHDKPSIIFYSFNLLGASLCNWGILHYSWKKKFLKPHITGNLYRNIRTKVLIPIPFYLTAIGVSFFYPMYATYFLVIPILFHISPGKIDFYKIHPLQT